MKNLTSAQMYKKFENQTYKKRVSILLDALGYMEQYNGRTQLQCIALAMGYESDYDENNQRIYVETSRK
jgi:hypothetical protein